MTAADRLAVGLALIVAGIAGALLGWPYMGAVVGFGLGFVIVGGRRIWVSRRRKAKDGAR